MVAAFEFATATRIVFGAGTARNLAKEARALGSRFLLVTGRNPARAAWLSGALDCPAFSIAGEPTVDDARSGAALARREGCDAVIAIGGGSAIDGGKAIAALAANSGEPLDYLEVVGRGQPLTHAALPFIAVPTTAGTGAEVTRNAVLQSPEHGVKASLRSALMLPKLAVVDPELTYDLPRELTASTGLDALTQLIEPFTSARANPVTDALARDGIVRVARGLPKLLADLTDTTAREDMALASLYGGLCLANAGLGVVHGFAAPIGGMFPAPHGAACAAVLPHGVAANLRALKRQNRSTQKYDAIEQLLGAELVPWLAALCRDAGIPPLRQYGMTAADIPAVAAKAAQASSMKANPVALDREELIAVLEAAF